jgi:hypothetical protein
MEREHQFWQQRLPVEAAPGVRLVLRHHPAGHHSILAAQPGHDTKPVILFSSHPK